MLLRCQIASWEQDNDTNGRRLKHVEMTGYSQEKLDSETEFTCNIYKWPRAK
jgi:hypothetical protein